MCKLLLTILLYLFGQSYLDFKQGFETFPSISVDNIHNAKLSQNDLHLYLVNEADDLLKVFSYDKETGYLRFVQLIENSDISNKFDFVQNISIHPNDQWVYTINQSDRTILKFDRQPGGSLNIDNTADTVLPSGGVGKNMLISSNGVDLYTGTRLNGSLFHYKINQSNGHLTLHQTIANGDMSGGNTITTLIGAEDFWMSNDEAFFYMTTFNGSSLLVFSREPNGNLTFVQKIENNFGGISGMVKTYNVVGYDTLNESFLVIMAEENSSSRLFAFSRNTSTGLLSYLGRKSFPRGDIISSQIKQKLYYCSNSTSVQVLEISSTEPDPFIQIDSDSTPQSNGCGGFVLSSDDNTLLKVARFSKNVLTYKVAQTGTIEQLLTYPPSQVEDMEKVTSITSANNSPHVYVTSPFSSSINTFYRQADGSLTYMDSFVYVDDGVSGNDGLSFIFDLVISNDGLSIYTAGYADDGVGYYTRNNNSGSALHGLLSYQEIYKNGIDGVTGLDGVYSLKLSNDVSQNYLYTTSLEDDSVTVFARNIDGSLNQIQTVTNATHSGLLADPSEIHLNSDSTKAYVVSFIGHAIFEYDVVNGQLSYSETLDDPHFGFVDEYFRYPTSLALINKPGMSEHNSFYVFSETNDRITFIQRDSNTGNYSIGSSYSHLNLFGICSLLLNSSQEYLHVSCRDSDVVKTFKINSDYSLSAVNLHKQLQDLVIGIDQPGLMKYSFDGEYLYVPGYISNGFAVFKPIDDFIFASSFDK